MRYTCGDSTVEDDRTTPFLNPQSLRENHVNQLRDCCLVGRELGTRLRSQPLNSQTTVKTIHPQLHQPTAYPVGVFPDMSQNHHLHSIAYVRPPCHPTRNQPSSDGPTEQCSGAPEPKPNECYTPSKTQPSKPSTTTPSPITRPKHAT